MNTTTTPFQSLVRPELSLKRRVNSNTSIPFEPDNIVPKERRISGPYGLASLQEAWDKLYRARAILEAEQSCLRDDRIALQGELEALEVREQAVAAREERIQQIEMQAAFERVEVADAQESESTLARLTRAPFDMARSVFRQKK